MPLAVVPLAFDDEIDTLPLMRNALPPLVTAMLPPAAATPDEYPAETVMLAPPSVSDAPAERVMLPAEPPIEEPLMTLISPAPAPGPAAFPVDTATEPAAPVADVAVEI